MKKILSILFIAFTLTSAAQNIWRAPSVFEQPVNFKAAISQNSGTDSLKINTVGANSILSHGTGALLLKDGKATIGLFDTTGYRVAATPINIQLQQGATDSILISFSGDTAHVNATVAAWNFTPPLPGGGGSGWSLTGNAGTNPATNFIGTTDGQPLTIKSDSFSLITYKNNASAIIVGNATGFGANDSTIILNAVTTSINADNEMGINGKIITIFADTTKIKNALILENGTQGAGKVLTSDANGLASWTDGNASNVWSLNGNAGTNPATNFIGTTDAVNFNIKANSAKQIEFSGDSANFYTRIYFANGNTAFYELSDSTQNGDIVAIGDAEASSSGNRIEIKPNATTLFDRFNLYTDSIIVINQAGINNYPFQFDVIDSVQSIYGHIKIVDGTQGAGKVLTSDSNGLASWQGGIIYDSLTSLTGQTITLTNNSTHIIAASGTIVSVTWSFPAGVTGDVLDIENMQIITTLNITGTGTGTITAAKITNTKTAGLKTFHNYGGNWY